MSLVQSAARRADSAAVAALRQIYCDPMQRRRDAPLSVGLELEFPLVSPSELRPEGLEALLTALASDMGLSPLRRDGAGEVVAARFPGTATVLSFEYARSLIEISLAPERCCRALASSARRSVNLLRASLAGHGLDVAFAGLHPQGWSRSEPPLPMAHYAAVDLFLASHASRPEHRGFVAYTASLQTHLSATPTTLPGLIELMRDIGFVRALLLANSASGEGAARSLVQRDQLWRESAFGQVLAAEAGRMRTLDDVLDAEAGKAAWHATRDGVQWVYDPVPIWRIDRNPKVAARAILDGEVAEARITLDAADLRRFRGYDDVVPTRFGTVEVRGDCEQPLDDIASIPAFYAGLSARLDAALDLVREVVPEGAGRSLRSSAARLGWSMPSPRPTDSLAEICAAFLDLAEDGLAARKRGEGGLLAPLRDRLNRRSNPALEASAHRSPI